MRIVCAKSVSIVSAEPALALALSSQDELYCSISGETLGRLGVLTGN